MGGLVTLPAWLTAWRSARMLAGGPESHFGPFTGPPELPPGEAVRLQAAEARTGSLVRPPLPLLERTGSWLILSSAFPAIISGSRTFLFVCVCISF